jgi:hypothetical protein
LPPSPSLSPTDRSTIECHPQRHPMTPWRHLPNEGRHQRKLTQTNSFNELTTNGKKFHLHTKLQTDKKALQKEQQKAAARLKKRLKRNKNKRDRSDSIPLTPSVFAMDTNPALKQKGVSAYTQSLRKGLSNYFHIGIRNECHHLWVAMIELAARTGHDEKDLIEVPDPPEPTEENALGNTDSDTVSTDPSNPTTTTTTDPASSTQTSSNTPQTPKTSQKSIVMDKHGIGRPLYFRFYRRLFVALRSMQDHISEKESKQRVRDAEVMAGILKRKEKKSKLGLKGFTRRSSSGGILGFNNGKGGLNALLGKIAEGSRPGSKSTNNLLQLKRRNSDVAPLSSGAKNKWGMIKREVCNTMSWKDLLKKRKEARAARAVKAGELTKIHKQLAMKDWSKDSTFVGVEVPLKTIPKTTLVFDTFSGTANSRTTSGGTANNNRNKSGSGNGNGDKGPGLAWESPTNTSTNNPTNNRSSSSNTNNTDPHEETTMSMNKHKQQGQEQPKQKTGAAIRDPVEEEQSRILKKKRISEEDFKESMVVLARHYATSGSALDFVHFLKQLVTIVFHDVDVHQGKRKWQRDKKNVLAQKLNKKRTIVVVPPRKVNPNGWTERRVWDMKAIQLQGRKKMWDSSCRLPNDMLKYSLTRERQDWFDEGEKGVEEALLLELKNTQIQKTQWIVGFGGTVVTERADAHTFASTW